MAASTFALDGRSALLTGASAGLGARFAEVLSGAGARVALVARRVESLESLADRLPNCVAVAGDLADLDALPDLYARAEAAVGPIDLLVNNAAFIVGGRRAEDETVAEITRTLHVNLVPPPVLAQSAYRSMRERGGGSIVNVSSVVARVGIGRFPQATYAATKGAIEAITREWAAQWSRHGIRVNCIAPGFLETEMTQAVIHEDNVQAWILRNTMIPRHGQPSDCDGALLYLASDASAYVTGQTIVVDGGWTAR